MNKAYLKNIKFSFAEDEEDLSDVPDGHTLIQVSYFNLKALVIARFVIDENQLLNSYLTVLRPKNKSEINLLHELFLSKKAGVAQRVHRLLNQWAFDSSQLVMIDLSGGAAL